MKVYVLVWTDGIGAVDVVKVFKQEPVDIYKKYYRAQGAFGGYELFEKEIDE